MHDQVHRFLIVEDDSMVARCLVDWLRPYGESRVVDTLAEARATFAEESAWSGLCIDVGLPDGNGLTLLADLRKQKKWIPTLVLTGRREPELIREVQSLLAWYAEKPAIEEGLMVFAEFATTRGTPPSAIDIEFGQAAIEWVLTPQERKVLELALEGLSIGQIASRLDRSSHTISTHTRSIKSKVPGAGSIHDVVREVLQRARG